MSSGSIGFAFNSGPFAIVRDDRILVLITTVHWFSLSGALCVRMLVSWVSSADGTIALAGYTITDDGKLMAYGLSSAGSDWETEKCAKLKLGARWCGCSTTSTPTTHSAKV